MIARLVQYNEAGYGRVPEPIAVGHPRLAAICRFEHPTRGPVVVATSIDQVGVGEWGDGVCKRSRVALPIHGIVNVARADLFPGRGRDGCCKEEVGDRARSHCSQAATTTTPTIA